MLKAVIFTILWAIVPVIELRGAIPIGVGLGLSPLVATLFAMLATKVFDCLRNKKHTHKFITWLEKKATKNHDKVEKYGWLGLIILVAIPLPGTGAWTGALVASCFQMDRKKSFGAISIGVVIAAIIVFLITYGITALN